MPVLSCVLGSVMPVPAAPPLYTRLMPSGIASAPPSGVAASVPVAALGTDTRSMFVSLGAPLSSAPPIVDTKVVPTASLMTSAGSPPTSQEPAGGGIGQSSAAVVPVAAPPAPTVVVKQPEPVRPYTGTTSYKAYKVYFERICVSNDWKTPTECARFLVIAMDGAASEAVRGLTAQQDTDLALIWEALARRFGSVDEPERAMRRFDVRKQPEGSGVCGCSIVKLGRRRILSRLKRIHCYVASSSMAYWTWNSRGICVSMPPRMTLLQRCQRQDSFLTPAS